MGVYTQERARDKKRGVKVDDEGGDKCKGVLLERKWEYSSG